jgi:hypothetical protein
MSETPNRYLDLLSFESAEQAYAEVKKLASSLDDKEHFIRSCIFDLHAAAELELRRVLYHTFNPQLCRTDDEEHNERVEAELEKRIQRLGFMEMFRILSPVLNSWPYPELKNIQAVNETRNQAAHGDIKRVRYKGRNPFEDGDCFAQMYFDVWAFKNVMSRFFGFAIERPITLLKRYIEKYGSELI